MPHLAAFDADPPAMGNPMPQHRRRAGQVHILVTDLYGSRHCSGGRPAASLAGHNHRL